MWIGHSLNMTHAEQKEMVAHSERVLKNTYIYILFFLIQMFY